MDSLSATALEDIRRLAGDLLPGAEARLLAPDADDPVVRGVAGGDVPVRLKGAGFRAGLPLTSGDGRLLAVLSVSAPAPPAPWREVRDRLTRLGRLAVSAPLQADARREAFATLVRSMPVSVVMTDLEMRVLAASPRLAADFGFVEDELIGRSLYEIAPHYFPNYRDAYDRTLAGETITTPRFRSPRLDGGIDWLRTELMPWRDTRGQIGGLISVAVDITDMVEALARVERSEQRLKMAVEIADLHVWEVDYGRQTIEVAGAPESFFDEEFDHRDLARDTNITIHPEDRARLEKPWRDAVMNDLPFRPEYRVNRKDGKEVWATCTTKLVRDETGMPLRLVGAMQNITERKVAEAALLRAKEEAEAANRAKSSFLAVMSHEIRTPLNGVLGMAQAMSADELTPQQRGRVETIRESGEALLVMLNDLLDLSKIEAGKLDLESAEFELTPLLSAIHAGFREAAARKGVTLQMDVDEAARGLYRGDAARLRQVVFNLVSNALKFTEAGEVEVAARRAPGALVLTVRDTGIGIPADRLPHLFQKFEQVDASTTRRFGGTGLGLAICRDLATLMGGDITARSEEGAGSVFEVRLPLARLGDETDRTDVADADAGDDAAHVALRVLAAEDNAVNQLVLRTLMAQIGVEPVIVNDGAEAVAAWKTGPWDLILMDVQMPVMDGPTAARAIRAAEAREGRPRTPIIALTANAMAHQLPDYAAAGMDGHLAKPIRVEDLFAVLQATADGLVDDERARAAG